MSGEHARRTRRVVGAGVTIALLSAFLATRGGPDADALDSIGAVTWGWMTGGVAGLLWCAAGLGLGWSLLRMLWPGAAGEAGAGRAAAPLVERFGLSAGVGVGVMVWLAHLMGVAGLFGTRGTGAVGGAASWLIVLLGVWLLVKRRPWELGREWGAKDAVAPWWCGLVVGVARWVALSVLVVATCVPPGTLWASEARGYDALSYHLALPLEWRELGVLRPLEHNVYSFLPSYVEAAYLQLLAMLGGRPGDGDARWLTACSGLHAGITLLAGLSVGGLASALARRAAPARGLVRCAPLAAAVGCAAVVATPWSVVTGSLAYNEMAVVLLLASACHLALAGKHGAPRGAAGWRATLTLGVSIGALLGAAVGCKPTAAFMGGPVVALAVLGWNRRGMLGWLVLGAVVGGLAASLPWLTRNWAFSGNPVFPSLTSVFGAGHWDAGQHERWHAAHHSMLAPGQRGTRLFASFGVAHPQWGVAWALFLLGAAACLVVARLRRLAWVLTVGLAVQVIAWMFIGHQQPRFLMPCLCTGGVLAGLASAWAASAGERGWWSGGPLPRVVLVATCGLVVAQAVQTGRVFMKENDGAPTRGLIGGAGAISGAALGPLDEIAHADRAELIRLLGQAANPVAATNILVGLEARDRAARGDPSPVVYLLGDATPVYFSVTLLWNTVWDTWPLDLARRAAPEDPGAWGAALRDRGVTHVLVNFAELRRFQSSGYAPTTMTVETAQRFVEASCEPVLEWPRIGVGLYRLRR